MILLSKVYYRGYQVFTDIHHFWTMNCWRLCSDCFNEIFYLKKGLSSRKIIDILKFWTTLTRSPWMCVSLLSGHKRRLSTMFFVWNKRKLFRNWRKFFTVCVLNRTENYRLGKSMYSLHLVISGNQWIYLLSPKWLQLFLPEQK